jgi:hypothetical protein
MAKPIFGKWWWIGLWRFITCYGLDMHALYVQNWGPQEDGWVSPFEGHTFCSRCDLHIAPDGMELCGWRAHF